MENPLGMLELQCGVIFSKILGIEIVRQISGVTVLVHGGRYLAAFGIVRGVLQKLYGCKFSDLISSIHCEDDLDNICLITGHNIALLITLEEPSKESSKESFRVKKRAKCEDNSMLYCSHVEGKNWEDFLVFSGTALGEVILWQPRRASTGILHRFTAHKGVIFSITTEEDLLVTTSDDRSAKIWKREENQKIVCIASLFGHKSRVFRSKIVEKNKQRFILTIGEDSNLCVWHESGKFLFRKALYSGAVIWNLDYDRTQDTVLTSGSDGNVKKLNLREILDRGINESPRKALLDEKISKILFIDSQTILVMTSEMFLMKLEASEEWRCQEKMPIPNIYIALIENVDGKVLICSHHEAIIYQICDSGVQEEHRNCNLLEGLIRTFYQISPEEYFFVDDRGNCAVTDKALKILVQFSVSLCKDLWYTKWITMARRVADYLLMSDRLGHLHLCRVFPGQIIIEATKKCVHGNLGVTQIHTEEISEESAEFWTSGRDGVLRKFLLDRNEASLREIFTEKVPISWVERIFCLKSGQKLILGFNDENLVVWERNHGVIFQLCTGGGHKYWDFVMNAEQNAARVISVWEKKPFLDNFSLENLSEDSLNIPTVNWHFRSCNCGAILKTSSGKSLLISGGDDNVLRINFLGKELTHVSEIVTHISNIRAVKLMKLPEKDSFLLFSVGGRAQMCLTRILARDKPQIHEFVNYMLKAKDFRKNRQSQMIDFCPETRFMCLTIDGREIFVGCSDGYVRKFRLEEEKIHLISSVFYRRCILNIEIIECQGRKILLTMGTDGKIILWNAEDFSNDSIPFHSISHHESGINCFDVWKEGEEFTVLTGGDDQKITKTVFGFESGKIVQKETCKTSLHFAQVTGIKIANKDEFFSTSVDQRIVRGNLHDLSLICEKFTSVSDLKGLLMLDKCNIVVFGAGIETISF
ncbi:tRNA (34-2'-O)-methyltransferase regulator WDR6 [Phlebotomus argentipes]|uniref:tRNA (34-2'-O)-methyltransferase regulator WDR6 n=1 Tax=Phlebotomus argentipes TaxID=94469 RepID=UPI00289357AC|nr:tRNA (34-2'-O)-methyltransferase regulator WDR6 [Phlebotomus argentipes]